jgi:hypothetical protein
MKKHHWLIIAIVVLALLWFTGVLQRLLGMLTSKKAQPRPAGA